MIDAGTPWPDAACAAALCAVDPSGTGGVVLRAAAGPQRERWLALLEQLLPPATPLRRMPAHIDDERLLGGLDLAATLHAGRPIALRGLLADSDGGLVIAAMAERLPAGTVARLQSALDTQQVTLQRDGLAEQRPARIGLIALDEGIGDDERVAAPLLDRLAFHVVLAAPPAAGAAQAEPEPTAADIAGARARLGDIETGDDIVQALCETAVALGIASLRGPLLALRVARAAAALAGRRAVHVDDAALAARLVLAPRATTLPAAPPDDSSIADAEPPAEDAAASGNAGDERSDDHDDAQPAEGGSLDDIVLAAARAALPADALAQWANAAHSRAAPAQAGRFGATQTGMTRGRPLGARRGAPQRGARLDIVATLRAAAPWQRLRRAGLDRVGSVAGKPRIELRRGDFHVTRFEQRRQTTTIFVVDASGSAAMHRLAEAKGAVELLLAECYVRRDRVALLAFRGTSSELLLPPTRSLVRAKRCLAGLPGGGGTPLAAGLDAARALAEPLARRGDTPLLVLLTDGRANIARDGSPGRAQALQDALASARGLRLAGLTVLLLDTSAEPYPQARELAVAMGARYLPLPHADAARLSAVVRVAAAG